MEESDTQELALARYNPAQQRPQPSSKNNNHNNAQSLPSQNLRSRQPTV